MEVMPYADPIDGVLTVPSSLIIYDGGYYSLDGGATVSTDTIGPETQITAASGASISILLQNASPVGAKWISVPNGALDIVGPGAIMTDNQTVAFYSRICGIRTTGSITIRGGATVRAAGVTDGITSLNAANTLTVTEGSELYGEFTGSNPTVTGAGKYGVYCGGSIVVSSGSRIQGTGALESYGAYGVFCDASHARDVAMDISADSSVTGTASVGVYLGGPTIVNGALSGTGGSLRVAHGIQGDRAGITVGPGAVVNAAAEDGAYAGIIMVYGYEIDGGRLTGTGGAYGVRSAGSGGIEVKNYGTITGVSGDAAGGYGIFVLNGDLTVNQGIAEGTGTQSGISVGGSITAQDGTVEGFTYAYGRDSEGYFGAVIAGGTITAVRSQIIENYSRVEYFDEAFRIPYQNGKNMSSYLNYSWSITAGAGAVESDPQGLGIHAVQSGAGTLTARRFGPVAGEVVELNGDSEHLIHIPVELSTAAEPEYMVTYDGNGAAGGRIPVDGNNPYMQGDLVTVLGNTGDLARPGYRFAGWSTSPDGSGALFREGDTFVMPDGDVTLYALWEQAPSYTLAYDGNGAAGGAVPVDPRSPYLEGEEAAVLGNTGVLSRPGYRFVGWSMAPDGGGVIYQEGDTFLMPPRDVVLYAVWEATRPGPGTAVYCGVCPARCCSPCGYGLR